MENKRLVACVTQTFCRYDEDVREYVHGLPDSPLSEMCWQTPLDGGTWQRKAACLKAAWEQRARGRTRGKKPFKSTPHYCLLLPGLTP